MDQLQYQNIASSLSQTIKSHQNLYKLTQVLVSLSLCSFIFSPSSLLVFLHYVKFYLSTIPFQLFTHNIDKNSMFLLCNGLLVFVGITRSFSASSGNGNDHQQHQQQQPSKYVELDVDDDDSPQTQFIDVDANESMLLEEVKEKRIEIVEQNIDEAEQVIENKRFGEEAEENIEKVVLLDEEQEEGVDQSILEEEEKVLDEEIEVFAEVDEEGDKGYSEIDHFKSEENIEDEEDLEEEEDDYRLSTEELNKKFDDFIRRMKEGLRIEAKSQLVMV